MTIRLILLGAGGGSIDVAEAIYLGNRAGLAIDLLGFLDDDPSAVGLPELGYRVLGPINAASHFADAQFILGIASDRNMRAREAILERLALPEERWFTFVHRTAQVSPTARVGRGVVVMDHALVGPRCVVADHAQLSARVSVGHLSTIGRGTIIAQAATISGRVQIDDGVYVGGAAVIKPDVTIGARAVVGIGAVVVKSVEAATTVVGNPARPIDRPRSPEEGAGG